MKWILPLFKIETWTAGCKSSKLKHGRLDAKCDFVFFWMLHCAIKDHNCDLYIRCHLWSSARPPTEASWMCGASENSVQSLLQLLHGKCPQSVGGWIWFEHARLLGEGVDALLCWSSNFNIPASLKFPFFLISLVAAPKRDSMTPFTCLFFRRFVSATDGMTWVCASTPDFMAASHGFWCSLHGFQPWYNSLKMDEMNTATLQN